MKKMMIFAAVAAMMMMQAPISASACSDDDVKVMVKAEIDLGTECVYSGYVGVDDMNGDRRITTDEVLVNIHDQNYPGGVAAGLSDHFVWGRRGTFITEVRDENGKLRVENPEEYEAGTAAPVYSRTVEAGDSIRCFAVALDSAQYELTVENTDLSLSIYDKVPTGTAVTFGAYCYDPCKADPIPVPGVELLQNGKGTGIKTDGNGKATLTLAQAGDCDIAGDFGSGSDSAGSFSFHVMDAQKIRRVNLTVRKNEGAPELNTTLNVYDADNDGRISVDDAFCCAAMVHYPIGNYPDKVFGSDGSFICTVSDKNGKMKMIAPIAALNKTTEIEAGDTVDFAPEGLRHSEKRAAPAEAAQTTAPAVTTAAETTATEAETTAAQTAEAAVTAAAAETAARTTAAPAQTTAAGTVRTGSLQTGDSAPLLACAVCMLSGIVALVFSRKRCR